MVFGGEIVLGHIAVPAAELDPVPVPALPRQGDIGVLRKRTQRPVGGARTGADVHAGARDRPSAPSRRVNAGIPAEDRDKHPPGHGPVGLEGGGGGSVEQAPVRDEFHRLIVPRAGTDVGEIRNGSGLRLPRSLGERDRQQQTHHQKTAETRPFFQLMYQRHRLS